MFKYIVQTKNIILLLHKIYFLVVLIIFYHTCNLILKYQVNYFKKYKDKINKIKSSADVKLLVIYYISPCFKCNGFRRYFVTKYTITYIKL